MSLHAAAQQGVPRGLAADRAARQHPDPAGDRRPDAQAGADYAVGYIDIDRFKSVNDVYGFVRGDEFITALARSLHRAVVAVGLPPAFLGHIGGDDFVIVCAPDQVLPLTKRAVTDFEKSADQLYDAEDAERGYIEVTDRRGNKQRAALVTLSIGVAAVDVHRPPVHRPARGGRGGLRDEEGRQEPARLVRGDRPPPRRHRTTRRRVTWVDRRWWHSPDRV